MACYAAVRQSTATTERFKYSMSLKSAP
jgi:hypothetical protein